MENFEERLARLKEGMAKKEEPESGRWQKWKKYLKKAAAIACPFAVIGGILTLYLAKDYLTKRQNYPERNVLFRSSNVVYVAGGSEARSEKNVDQESITKVYEGGVESKVGTYLFQTVRELREDIEYFNMDNSQKIRIASATKKPEKVQAGLRIGGSLNFREQFAEIILGEKSKAPQDYSVYKFIPERGTKEKEITIVENVDGTRQMENRMTELRTWPLGWYWGKVFRKGTFLEDYARNPENEKNMEEFLKTIKVLNSVETKEKAKREQMIWEAIKLEDEIKKNTIYTSFEDGIVDLLPQESSIYVGHYPGFFERWKHNLGFGTWKDRNRLRVENYWDLWPGNYWLLNRISFGSGDNVLSPFAKYNNGGYEIEDKFGKIAKIDIRDFILFYGQDILYSYYFDLNGDGELDEEKELIGQVLCRVTHDERINLESLVGEGKPKSDVSFTINYSFMSPTPDLEKGIDYFNLCGYVESCMPDQINRGFGKHSMLGFINEQRSDIMLYKDLTIENMSRALTQESTLVAKNDIVKVLIAAKRPYAKEVAESYGIDDKFEGQYQSSDLLSQRWSKGPFWLAGLLLLSGLGYAYYRKRKAIGGTENGTSQGIIRRLLEYRKKRSS